jgi:hypothetical protein
MSNASDCSYNSYCPDFKNYIDEDNGSSNLFYIRAHSIDHQQPKLNTLNSDELFRNEFKRMSLKRDKGILSKFANKKSKFDLKVVERNIYTHENGKTKELKIGNKMFRENKLPKPRAGDERTLFEIIFNASLIIGPDNRKFIVDKINQSSIFEKDLSVGDLIKSINGDVINPENLNHILAKIIHQKSFKIVAEECCKDEYFGLKEEIKITKVNDIVAFKNKLFQLDMESHELVFSLNVIVKNEQISEDSDDYTTVFSYPPKENNFLHKLKGSFLTIASIMKNAFNTYPTVTNIRVHNTTFHVTYTIRNGGNEFIFLGFNSNYAGGFDAKHLTTNFVKFLDYIYPNFIIINDFDQLNSFCEIMKIQLIKRNSDAINFEQLFSCSRFVSLPKEIVLRINDALSELEAMDYRNWNETLMELFGKFSIIGSCLFYKTSLICSHFNETDMENVDLFLRHVCLKFMFERCLLREVAIWQRVYPKDYQSFNMENDSTKNKVFLLAVSNGNLTMCVILEENSFNVNPETESQSSNYLIYFLEEMEDVVNHLKMVGIENLTKIWINSAKRPQCKNPFAKEPELSKKDQQQLRNIREESEDEESEKDYDSHLDGQSTRQSSSGGGFDNEEAIYKDFEDIIPQTLTFGPENVLYHFTQIDFKEGLIITSLNEKSCIPPNDILVDIFRRGCLSIHHKLQGTVKFNQLLTRENRVSNSSTMLPKEQGMLVEVQWEKSLLNFWIIGRLFGTRELYICHDARIPQNMVEIGFRLAINCCG